MTSSSELIPEPEGETTHSHVVKPKFRRKTLVSIDGIGTGRVLSYSWDPDIATYRYIVQLDSATSPDGNRASCIETVLSPQETG